ncbi:MAG: GNAT family N-acetyltransferase [Clostridia bacterium]|nr:GNAT family N-acetyltransferase [Clostridia bacterium]
MLTLRDMTKEQISVIYDTRMKYDFPPDELKPLGIIFRAIDGGIYDFLGLSDGEDTVGYVSLIRHGADFLIDYLAIYRERRDSGLGGNLLRMLTERYPEAGSMLVEVEDPDCADGEDEKKTRIRRLDFYLRNGYTDTGAAALCFGVKYKILEAPVGGKRTCKDTAELYRMHYRSILPAEIYRKNIMIL